MYFKKIFGVSIDELYWNLKVGKSVRKATIYDIRSNLNNYIKKPIFFLSTGRCGTKWFSDLYERSSTELMVLHSPIPSFASQSPAIYNACRNGSVDGSSKALANEVFFAGREQYLRFAYKSNKRYIETNNYISFFAPLLAELFPDAKFVHLYRHPGEFVRSGMRRNYYTEGNTDDIKRIVNNSLDWETQSRIGKIAWLWNETNSFIERFKQEKNCYNFNFNELNLEMVMALNDYLEISVNPESVKKALRHKTNVQKRGAFSKYSAWRQDDKDKLIAQCSELAKKYNYTL